MAEGDPLDIEPIKLLLASGKDVTESIRNWVVGVREFAEGAGNVEEKLTTLQKNLEGTNASIGRVTDTTNLFARANINMIATGEALTVKMGGASASFLAFKNDVSQGSASIQDSLGELGKFTGKVQEAFKSLATSGGPLGKAASMVANNFKEVFAATERVQDMERGFLSLGAVTGNLGQVFEETGELSGEFDGNMAQFTKNIMDASQATGVGVGKLSQAVKELGQIPGALDAVVGTGSGNATELVAVTQVAAATGKDLKVVIGEMTKAYSDLGLKGQEAINYLSTIATASDGLHIPLDVTTNSINKLSTAYAFLTNNTDGAVKAFSKFVPALQDVGLSPQQATQMFDKMAESIKGLDVGTKAFLAQRSGVGSGLQGAFKIDKMVKDGKIDEVMNMMQKNLQRQIGSNVVTLDQASESSQAASQYQRQLSYLKSSAFGSMLGTDKDADDKASKLFEAMKKGSLTKDAKEAITGKAATDKVTTKGASWQRRMTTVVSMMATDVQRMAANEDRNLADIIRLLGGSAPGSPVEDALARNAVEGRAEGANSSDIKYQDPENASIDVLRHMVGMLGKIKTGYMGEKDMFGKDVVTKPEVPAPHGGRVMPSTPQQTSGANPKEQARLAMAFKLSGQKAPSAGPMRDAVKQNIAQTRTRSSVSPTAIGNAAKEGASGKQTAGQSATSTDLTIKLENHCPHCKTTSEIGTFHKTVAAARDASALHHQSSVSSPAQK